MAETLYFAYGANLWMERRLLRDGDVRTAGVARLIDFRLVFNMRRGRGAHYANVMPSPADVVWGALYGCNTRAMDFLDRYEGVADGDYRRVRLAVESLERGSVSAEVYVAGDDCTVEPGRPRAPYLRRILAGAREHRLPSDYIESLESLATLPGQ